MTPGEITNGEMSRWLERVEKKLDRVTDDHEARLRRVERAMYVSVGLAAAGATSGVGAMLSVLGGGG